jgi:hypothetical protein
MQTDFVYKIIRENDQRRSAKKELIGGFSPP